jgi:hypothetical protein
MAIMSGTNADKTQRTKKTKRKPRILLIITAAETGMETANAKRTGALKLIRIATVIAVDPTAAIALVNTSSIALKLTKNP